LQEFRRVAKELGMQMTEEELQDVIDAVDSTGDLEVCSS